MGRENFAAAAPSLPAGGAWLLLEVGGDTAAEARAAAAALADAVRGAERRADTAVVTDPAEQRALWRIREDAAGAATRLNSQAKGTANRSTEAWPGWEDAAVPVEHLGDYLRRFRALMSRHQVPGIPYGHFGEGCVHVRLGFDLVTREGIAAFRGFLEEATDLVVEFGGSISGEHGDGLARSELLTRLYGPRMVALFERFKGVWDPEGMLNPGVIVNPPRVDATLRFPASDPSTIFSYPDDSDSFGQALRRCVGVGRCRQHGDAAQGSAMCPSFQVTRDEKDSTRGRAHILMEMLHGDVVKDGWRSEEVHDALDLCLSCKACLSDCPVDVDMATYKSEFLHHYYEGRQRPASHYALGDLPRWARAAALLPGAANSMAKQQTAMRIAGLDERRKPPEFAKTTFRRAMRHHRSPRGNRVLLWPDTFTDHFDPAVGVAAVRVLEDAGFEVELPRKRACCGLTYISTGQLDRAKEAGRRTLDVLGPALRDRIPIVALEPSCLTALRHDLPRLLSEDPRSDLLRDQVMSIGELLRDQAPDWRPVSGAGDAVLQIHCHQRSTTGYDAELRLLELAGISVEEPAKGCCGLAGNWGMERGHYEVSVACAEQALAPAVRNAPTQTLIIADGFSCRTQIADLTPRKAIHVVQALAAQGRNRAR